MRKVYVFLFLFLAFFVYSFFVYLEGTKVDGVSMSTEAVRGKLLYQKHNCTACHQIYGLGGYLGPDLTKVISSRAKNELVMSAMLRSGSQRMPNFNLNEIEIIEIIAYLKYIDQVTVLKSEVQ
ncbi:MAG: c-type cytochrome [Bacteroidia bacterium]|jgi:nitric oxide reductase subunit C|nr:c-type cytochrome [Bacteroidia bacterium]